MARRNLTTGQVTPDIKERLAQAFQPLLATCDCSMTLLSKEVPWEKFASNSPEVQQRARELTAKGGACELKGMAQAPEKAPTPEAVDRRSTPAAAHSHLGSQKPECVYKPVMSDEDLNRCR
jgi:hypothetical protein